MGEPILKYKCRLRNFLIITYWVFIFSCSVCALTYFSSSINYIVLLTISIIGIALIWPFRLLTSYIYEDMLVFKEIGLKHHMINVFGVAFENIADVTVRKKISTLNQIVIKMKNGEIVRRIISLSQNELSDLLKILNEKVKNAI